MEKSKNSQTVSNKNKEASMTQKVSNQKSVTDPQTSNQNTKISSSNSQATNDAPASIDDHDEFIPRKDVEFAFTCLTNWESSYDGVHRIWELIKNEPDIDLDDYFDSLDFAQKCFLVSGLYANMEDDKMENLAPIIDKFDQRMTGETKSDRVQREAQLIGEKMSELIKTETPKTNRIREINSGTILRSPSSSTSSKLTITPREIRSSKSSITESSISSKPLSRNSSIKTTISPNSSISSKSSKTPVINKSSSNAPTTAFGFSVKRPKNKPSSNASGINDNSISQKNQKSSNYNQNNISPKNKSIKNTDLGNNSNSPISPSLQKRISSMNSGQARKSKV